MADYIDRQAAIAALREFAECCKDGSEAATTVSMVISVLSRVPSPWADASTILPVDKLRNEIIPQYEAMLKKANAERDEAIQAGESTTARLNEALKQLKAVGCHTCAEYKFWTCDSYNYCLSHSHALWTWQGPEEGAENE